MYRIYSYKLHMNNKTCIKRKRKHISNLLHSWTFLKWKSKITYHMPYVLYRWIISYCTLQVEAFYQINVIISHLGSQKNPVNIGFHMTWSLSIFLKWMKIKIPHKLLDAILKINKIYRKTHFFHLVVIIILFLFKILGGRFC